MLGRKAWHGHGTHEFTTSSVTWQRPVQVEPVSRHRQRRGLWGPAVPRGANGSQGNFSNRKGSYCHQWCSHRWVTHAPGDGFIPMPTLSSPWLIPVGHKVKPGTNHESVRGRSREERGCGKSRDGGGMTNVSSSYYAHAWSCQIKLINISILTKDNDACGWPDVISLSANVPVSCLIDLYLFLNTSQTT